MATVPPPASMPLARQARERFVAHAEGALAPLCNAIRARLVELVDASGSSREAQDRRDAMLDFERLRGPWLSATQKAWYAAIVPATATARVRLDVASFELIGDDVVEQKILSSRLALAILEKATWELNDLRIRMQHLEGGDELSTEDVLRPEAVARLVVERWMAATLSRQSWLLVQDLILQHLALRLAEAYKLTNEFLIKRGVMPEIDLSARVKRGGEAPAASSRGPAPQPSGPGALSGGAAGATGQGATGFGGAAGGNGGGSRGNSGGGGNRGGGGSGGSGNGGGGGGSGGNRSGNSGGSSSRSNGGGSGSTGMGGDRRDSDGGRSGSSGFGDGGGGGGGGGGRGGGRIGGGGIGSNLGGRGAGTSGGQNAGSQNAGTQGSDGPNSGTQGSGGDSQPGHGGNMGGVADETRLMTASTPLARARMRASGVLGQLKRMLVDRVAGFDSGQPVQPSPALAEAIAQQAGFARTRIQAQGMQEPGSAADGVLDSGTIYDNAAVEQVATELRQRTGELKKKASTSAEKATIEIVALMFQAILVEERIPAPVRVWFARLQIPVLRVAIAEPEFFGTLEHPARQLIDRMGSVVMGFDTAAIGGTALEIEIKRVVQVIEQYPETGRRVFQLVYDEFQKFLARFLPGKGQTQRLVSVAQQVEQKETMAIQYTIEMRNMLNDIPVRDEIREFLFKVWAEVLAVAAVKNGPQHEHTVALKKSAAELVWSASAKPNRSDRAQVIADLPKLLQRLRQGMTLLGLVGSAQEAHIKIIGDTLADAFLSKTEAIPKARIDELSQRLANLEDYVADDPATDLPLTAESIELMLGIDASMIEVVADGGSRPTDAMLGWARELQLGTWFSIDHNSKVSHVQYVWRSDRGQLHVFARPDGMSFLVQLRRMAAYLQAGLLVPTEDEGLTVRATRDALAKLDANPERLLA